MNLERARQYVEAAPSREERRRRKTLLYMRLYGGLPRRCHTLLKRDFPVLTRMSAEAAMPTRLTAMAGALASVVRGETRPKEREWIKNDK